MFFPQQSLQTASGVRDLIGARVSVPGVKRPWVKKTSDFHVVPRNYTITRHNFTCNCCVCLEGVREAAKRLLEYSVYGPKEVMGKKMGTYKLVNHAYVRRTL